MDNASKAIIIAGGFLIGVIVISICMYMYTNYQVMYTDNMKMQAAQQAATFNSFFIEYDNQITGYEAYNIIGKINEINSNPDAITNISYSGINKDVFYFTKNFENIYSYSYEYGSDGLIESISIN